MNKNPSEMGASSPPQLQQLQQQEAGVGVFASNRPGQVKKTQPGDET